jgi:hypothetical protein
MRDPNKKRFIKQNWNRMTGQQLSKALRLYWQLNENKTDDFEPKCSYLSKDQKNKNEPVTFEFARKLFKPKPESSQTRPEPEQQTL